MKTHDVIVIGSGIGGLISAGILASAGMKVLVIERHVTPGGYLSSFRRKGFVFDSAVDCISGVADGGLIYRVMRMLGIDDDLRFIRIDPIRVSRFPDFDIHVDADPDAYKERLAGLFPSEASSIKEFFGRIGRAYSQLDSALWAVIADNRNLGMPGADALSMMDRSYGELLDEHFSDDRLKVVLSDRCPFIGLPPSRVSAAAMINLMMSYFELGAYRSVGGFQKLADAFVKGLKMRGAEVIFGKGVKRILLDEKNLCRGVVCEDGEEYGAGHIVSNADFIHTLGTMVGGPYGKIAGEMSANPGASTSFFILYAGVEGELNAHSSMGYYPSYEMEKFFDAGMELREDSTIGVTIASREDRTRAPEGCETAVFHEMVAASERHLDKSLCIERIIRKARRIFPGIEDRLVLLDAATPSTLRRYTGNYGGSAFGWRQLPGFRGPGRHGIRNLCIAGHWGDLGGGVLAAAYSGAKAARLILSMEGIRHAI